MSTKRWWSCEPDSLRHPKTLWPEPEGTTGEFWASWPPTEVEKQKSECTLMTAYPVIHSNGLVSSTDTRVVGCSLLPAPAFAQRLGADSDSPGCRHTAHLTVCRLHGTLWKFEMRSNRWWNQITKGPEVLRLGQVNADLSVLSWNWKVMHAHEGTIVYSQLESITPWQ